MQDNNNNSGWQDRIWSSLSANALMLIASLGILGAAAFILVRTLVPSFLTDGSSTPRSEALAPSAALIASVVPTAERTAVVKATPSAVPNFAETEVMLRETAGILAVTSASLDRRETDIVQTSIVGTQTSESYAQETLTAAAINTAIEQTVVARVTAIKRTSATPLPTRVPTVRPISSPKPVSVQTISSLTHWTPAAGPYTLSQDLSITPNGILIIEPGTEVRIAPGISIFVAGKLLALGTADARVRLVGVPSAAARPSWGGIFGDANSEVQLNNTEIHGAGAGGTTLASQEGTLIIQRSLFSGNGGQLLVRDSSFELRDTTIAGNDFPYGAAVDASYSYGRSISMIGNRVENNIVYEPGTPSVRIANTNAYTTLQLDLQHNIISSNVSDDLLLSTDGPLQGVLACNTFQGGSMGINLRTSTKQLPPIALQVYDNAIDGHTPPIIDEYLRYGIGRGAASEIGLSMSRNWWGHPSGPYDPQTNPLGRGDSVGVNIDYNNWLTTIPTCTSQ